MRAILRQGPTLASLLAGSAPCCAHVIGAAPGAPDWRSIDPLVLALLVLTALCYLRGFLQLRRRHTGSDRTHARRAWYFWGGWSMLFIALATPLDALGEQLFSAHMVQHELMMLVAAPLLVLSRPASALLNGCPAKLAAMLGRSFRRLGGGVLRRILAAPLWAWNIHFIGLWGWHLPVLFQAGLEHNGIHALQHLSFLLIGLVFWWALLRGAECRRNAGLAVLYLFTTTIHASILGALLTYSPSLWYPAYRDTAPAWGLAPLADQQLGGLIMWMPAGIVFIVAAALLLARALRDSDDDSIREYAE